MKKAIPPSARTAEGGILSIKKGMYMNTLHIPEKKIPVIDTFDTVVLGGGTAGAFAGIAAARRGSRTLIIEQFGALGGSATTGLVLPLMLLHIKNYDGHCPLSAELVERLRTVGGTEEDANSFDPVMVQITLEDMAADSNCDILYYTTLVNAVLEDRTITHVIVNNKNGLAAYKAKCFIDCTGDADLIKLVGASYQSGNHNRVNQPVSLRFDMAGIDFERFHAYMRSLGNDQYKYFAMNTPGMKDIIRKAYENGVLTEQDACYFQAFGIPGRPGGMNFNCPELTTKENVVDAEFMTQKQLEGKKAIMRLRKFLRDYIPGFENAYITSIAQLVGFRESRRIEAEYMLTIEDVLTYRKFPDGIAASHYPIDVHGVDDVSLGLKYQHDVPADEQYWEVPFRVMIPKTLDNVLTAGRCAGMDFRAQSAARIQPTCRSMGEAAGIAAAMAVKNEAVRFNEIDGTAVRREIRLPDKF